MGAGASKTIEGSTARNEARQREGALNFKSAGVVRQR